MKLILKKEHWPYYAQLMRLNRPIGTYLLLWPTLWALWIAAEGIPNWWVLVVFCLGVFLMRSAGCVINDYADRDFDAHVERTKQRPLAQNRITSNEALTVFFVLVLVALGLVLTLNYWFKRRRSNVGGDVPFYETLYLLPTSGFRSGIFLGNTDGICSNNR